MAPRSYVKLKDQAGITIAQFDTWEKLSYTRKQNAPDEHEFEINGNLPIVQSFLTDCQLEVWRSDPATNPPIPWYLEYEGFHRTPRRQYDAQNKLLFASLGLGYVDLLRRRHILYATGVPYGRKTGQSEDIIHDYVNENAGPAATMPPRLVQAGVTSGLVLDASTGGGTATDGDHSWKNLLDVCKELADVGPNHVDFRVLGDGAGAFRFRTKRRPFGLDRTNTGLSPVTGGKNSAGNYPVIFNVAFGNMMTPVYMLSRTQEANAIVISGQGPDANPDTSIVVTAAAADSPWNVCEAVKSYNRDNSTVSLATVAAAAVIELRALPTIDMRVLQTPGSLYGRDYFLGDLVTVQFQELAFDLQIVEVKVDANAPTGEIISLKFSDLII